MNTNNYGKEPEENLKSIFKTKKYEFRHEVFGVSRCPIIVVWKWWKGWEDNVCSFSVAHSLVFHSEHV